MQGHEDGFRVRGERSKNSSDDSDPEDNKGPAHGHEEFMRNYEHISVDDFDEEIMDGYESADRSEATSATGSAAFSLTAHIASTAQRSNIMSNKIDWESQKEFKPPG